MGEGGRLGGHVGGGRIEGGSGDRSLGRSLGSAGVTFAGGPRPPGAVARRRVVGGTGSGWVLVAGELARSDVHLAGGAVTGERPGIHGLLRRIDGLEVGVGHLEHVEDLRLVRELAVEEQDDLLVVLALHLDRAPVEAVADLGHVDADLGPFLQSRLDRGGGGGDRGGGGRGVLGVAVVAGLGAEVEVLDDDWTAPRPTVSGPAVRRTRRVSGPRGREDRAGGRWKVCIVSSRRAGALRSLRT